MSDPPSEIPDEGQELPPHFIITCRNKETRMVAYRVMTTRFITLDGNVGPRVWPGPFAESSDSERRRRAGESKRRSYARRNKGFNFVQTLHQSGEYIIPNILCHKCQSILVASSLLNGYGDKAELIEVPCGPITRLERLESFQHYSSYEDLKNSCHEQCHFCLLLWDIIDGEGCIEDNEDFGVTGKPVVVQVRKSGSKEGPLQINVALQETVNCRIEDDGRRCILIQRYPLIRDASDTEEDSETALLKTDHPAQLSISTAADTTFDLAIQWLRTCLQTHQHCQPASNMATALPGRLIWLGPPNLRTRARLCRTSNFKTPLPYCTLSHCWGGAQVTQLTQEVEKDFSKSIPFDDLPQTFKDAMVITKRLGYSYIWIDSLCIIQDNIEDWLSQSAIMGQVYRNSVCNLASLAATDSHGGFFNTRNPLLHRPCRLSGDSQSELYAFGYGDPTDNGRSRSRLISRAWVFQERLLSPRSLYFDVTGISWECASCSASEALPDGSQLDKEDETGGGNPKRALLSINSQLTRVQFRTKWSEIVATYSRCNLTKSTDRLAALHGVVKEWMTRLGDVIYVAGIWMDDPIFCLLWKTGKSQHSRPKAPYIAPTWSWASVDARAYMALDPTGKEGDEKFRDLLIRVTYNVREVATIVEVIAIPIGEGRYDNGQLGYAHLILNAPYSHVTWEDFKRSKDSSRDSRASNDTFSPDFRNCRFKPDDIWAVLICTCFAEDVNHEMKDGIDSDACIDIGLVLGRVETDDRRENVFERLGFFEQYYWKGEENIIFSTSLREARDLVII